MVEDIIMAEVRNIDEELRKVDRLKGNQNALNAVNV